MKSFTSNLKKKVAENFGSGRNLFIQVLTPNATLHDHFHHLKAICWKKEQPLYLMTIDPNDFENESELLRQLRIPSLEALKDTTYILVNEDGIKLPFAKNEVDMGIA